MGSWTDEKRKIGEDGVDYWPTRYYGCVWMPKGRIATGAILSNDGRLFVAATAQRCTVCCETDTDFDSQREAFCIEEHEDYRAPAAVCGQHYQNKRAFVRERSLDVSQLQRETNSLAGGENLTVIEFQLGRIPVLGGTFAPKIRSSASRMGVAFASGRHQIQIWELAATVATVWALAVPGVGGRGP